MAETAPDRRIATIDLGTNTALLLVADVVDGDLVTVVDEERFVRLGEGVDAALKLSEPAMQRAIDALTDYAAIAAESGALIVGTGATSATRDACNREQFITRVRKELGIEIDVLTGEEEAECSFLGAVSAYHDQDDVVVLDVGGGSAEVIIGSAASGPARRWSLDAGAVRLTERFFDTIPPSNRDVERAGEFVLERLSTIPGNVYATVIGASGTVRALAAVATEDRRETLSASEVAAWRDRLLTLSPEQVLALEPRLMAGRSDVFAAGVLIVAAVIDHFSAERLIASPRGLRHGLALRWLANQRTG